MRFDLIRHGNTRRTEVNYINFKYKYPLAHITDNQILRRKVKGQSRTGPLSFRIGDSLLLTRNLQLRC